MEIQLKDAIERKEEYKQALKQMQMAKCEDLILDKVTFLDPFLKTVQSAAEYNHQAYIRKFKCYKHDWNVFKESKNFAESPEVVSIIDDTILSIEKYVPP